MTTVEEATAIEGGGASPSSGRARLLGAFAVGLALLSALATFLILSGLTTILPTHEVVVSVLVINGATALLLSAVIVSEVWRVLQARRHGRAGARLHLRIAALFSLIAAVPAILVAIVASVTLDRGLDRWFSVRTRAVIENSLIVAETYVRDHAQLVRSELFRMSYDVALAKSLFDQDRPRFRQFLNTQGTVRGLIAAVLIKSDLSVVERTDLPVDREFAAPSSAALAGVTETEPRVAIIPGADYVAAVIKLRGYDDTFLYIARPLDSRVLNQIKETQASIEEFANLDARRAGVQVAFALMYTVIALIVLLSAIWIGLNFANRLVAPIRRLISAANLVSTGNLYVTVPVRHSEGDVAQLGESFNKMTQELRSQRDDLVRASEVIDSRRRFTEAVLAGASAGVIGTDANGAITILNRSAERLIGREEGDVIGQPLAEVVPELAALIAEARTAMQRFVHGQITISRAGKERNLSVRVTTEQTKESHQGFVVTLDDITDLVIAQRTSAWADVAQRIAHEIKNPLTPIQLSAERLRRKYGNAITEDRKVFDQCTDTIVRHVDDIKRMVDEFSRFARMPKPVMAMEDVAEIIQQTAFLMRNGHPEIDIEVDLEAETMPALIDRRLISQAMTNIIKNAAEAISAVPPEELGRGRISVTARTIGEEIVIDVVDNGVGLPKENRNRLLEPYFTTREKGTGLGLAIVGRILEDHGGGIELHDAPSVAQGGRGAWVRMRIAAPPGAEAASTRPEPAALES